MKKQFTRRDFSRLTMAAFGGAVAGTLAGCGGDQAPPASTPPASHSATPPAHDASAGAAAPAGTEVSLLMGEKHVCRGLNTCKGLGADGKNDCAGMGTCATYAKHDCAGHNECKGQGGCGENPGENACKGMGSCGVPLEHAWEKARKNFELAMEKSGKKVGVAPAKM